MFNRWQKAQARAQDLNLIPIMNLMVVLVPFLLLGAAFLHMSNIPASLPTHRPDGVDDEERSDVVVTLSLQVQPDRLVLTGSAPELSEEDLAGLALELEREGTEEGEGRGGFDLAGFQSHLHGIKERYPKSDTLVVLPADGVRYQTLVRVLDAAREVPSTQENGADGEHEPLFPVTVFSRLLEANGDGE